jgi:hypothetical protein
MENKYETLKTRKKVALSDFLRVVLVALVAIIKLTHLGF